CALTSFNPFTANHHYAIATEGTLTLSQQLPPGSTTVRSELSRSNSGTSQNRTQAALDAAKRLQEPNAQPVQTQTKPVETTEAGVCTDGKCDETSKVPAATELATVVVGEITGEAESTNASAETEELVICENKAEY